MTYNCAIIKDLLPLYIDGICSEESRQAVEKHLSECDACRHSYEAMRSAEGFAEKKAAGPEDARIADSLKRVKKRISRKIRTVILCAVIAAAAFVAGFQLLFHAALKPVAPEDVSVSAEVYSLEELKKDPAETGPDTESVQIFSDETDASGPVTVTIPQIGNITLSEDMIDRCGSATVITVRSEYDLKKVESEIRDHVLYISDYKTTLLNNRTGSWQQQNCRLEFQEINKIVFIGETGTETVLWNR